MELVFKPASQNHEQSLSNVVKLNQNLTENQQEFDNIFETFLGFEVADGKASPDTVANYKSQVKLYLEWCLDNQVNPLLAEKRQIQQYRQYLIKKNYKSATISLKLNVVRRFYDATIDHGLLNKNPAKHVKAPLFKTDPKDTVKFLTLEELIDLIDLTQGDSAKLKRDRIIISLMALQGLRTIELHKLSYEDISRQGDKKFITVSAKRGQRKIKIRNDVYSWLINHLITQNLKPNTPIVTSLSGNSKGKRLSRNGIRRIVNGYLARLDLRDVDANNIKLSNHALRHTFATQVYQNTKDLRLVQDALGHSDPRTTAKYAHIIEEVAAADAIILD